MASPDHGANTATPRAAATAAATHHASPMRRGSLTTVPDPIEITVGALAVASPTSVSGAFSSVASASRDDDMNRASASRISSAVW